MRKHTPGPWFILINPKSIPGTAFAEIADRKVGGRTVAHIVNALLIGPEALPNARLIAAAPDLLTALKELVARCDGDEGVTKDGSNIQTIIAHEVIKKAEGQ